VKYILILIAVGLISSGTYDLTQGESTLSHRRSSRTVSAEDDMQEFLGFVGIKIFAGCCFIGLYRFINKGEDTWY
jgi:hypothetical protein